MKKLVILPLFIFVVLSANALALPQCSDGIDNDGDGYIDYPFDTGCASPEDNDENVLLGYAHGCLQNGNTLRNVFGDITYHCQSTTCIVCVAMTEAGNYTTLPQRCNGLPTCGFNNGNFGNVVDASPPNITVNSPYQNQVSSSRTFLLNLSTNEPSKIHYKDRDNAAWKSLCQNCQSFAQTRLFVEGVNNITFRAVDLSGNAAFVTRTLIVDSKAPKILKYESTSGNLFSSGEFFIRIDEANPLSLVLHYGNQQTGMRERQIDFNDECVQELGTKKACTISVDLSDYDGQSIQYYVFIMDVANSSVSTNPKSIAVDNSEPVIQSASATVNGKKVHFEIEAYDENLKEIIYSSNGATWKKICAKNQMPGGVCSKHISFQDGNHEIIVRVIDSADNYAEEMFNVVIDSKKPKIRSSYPKSQFASGMFEVEFEEQNPVSLVLEYGNIAQGFRTATLNISEDCSLGVKYYNCDVNIDLGDYENEKIKYTFVVSDIGSQSAQKTVSNLRVDTIFPAITSITHGPLDSANRTDITINLVEQNLQRVRYVHNGATEKDFCTKIVCKRKIKLQPGNNQFSFSVLDKAGNTIAENYEITI